MNASLISISAQQSKHWCTGPLVAPRGPSCSVSKCTWVMLLTNDFKRLCRCWQNAAAAPSATPLLRRIRCHLFSLAPSLPRQTQPVLAIVCVCHQKKQKQNMTKDAHSPSVHCLSVCLLSLSDWKRHWEEEAGDVFFLSVKSEFQRTENPLSRPAVNNLLGVFSSWTKTLFTPFNRWKRVRLCCDRLCLCTYQWG